MLRATLVLPLQKLLAFFAWFDSGLTRLPLEVFVLPHATAGVYYCLVLRVWYRALQFKGVVVIVTCRLEFWFMVGCVSAMLSSVVRYS